MLLPTNSVAASCAFWRFVAEKAWVMSLLAMTSLSCSSGLCGGLVDRVNYVGSLAPSPNSKDIAVQAVLDATTLGMKCPGDVGLDRLGM